MCTSEHIKHDMNNSTTMTIRLEIEDKENLDKLAQSTQRSKSYLAAAAIRDYIEINQWQIAETELAIAEADAGDFADEEEITTTFAKWQ